MISDPPPQLAALFWAAFRQHCHKFLAIGYNEALPRILSGPDEETDITGFICDALEEWFRRNPRESQLFFLKEESPVSGIGRTGKRRPRTDIVIGYAAGDRPEFFFEAKRLHKQKPGVSYYVGADGMGRFLDGRYARRYEEAAMVGYVQTGEPEFWYDKLQQKCRRKSRQLNIESIENDVDFESSFPFEWSSTHRRQQLHRIKIFHIQLDCRRTST